MKKDVKGKKDKPPSAKKQPQEKIVLVTGSNRGIGKGIIEALLEKKSKLRIILTARNDEQGQAAYNELKEKYPEEEAHFFYHQWDITKEESVSALVLWIKQNYKKIDYLINNAGVSSKGTDFNIDVFTYTFDVNFYGTVQFTEKMIQSDMFNKGGKIIFIGSSSGSLTKITNENIVGAFKNAKGTDDLMKLAGKYKDSIINEKVEEDGWCKNTYNVSKMWINTYARVLTHKREVTREQLSVYTCNPGWVKTEMGGEFAKLEIKDGVTTPLFLLDLPSGVNKEFQGKYFNECKVALFE